MFQMIKDNLVLFLTGGLIPLSLLPAGLGLAMRFLPFYHVTYLPTMLLMGRNTSELGLGFIVLAVWNLAFLLINRATYQRLRTLYDGVGI